MQNYVSDNYPKKGTYRFGDFELDVGERILLRSGSRVPLTPRMFDLLTTLVQKGGHLVTKDELLDAVWADAAVEEGNLNRTISSLRKTLGEAKGENRYIETTPKAGYRFVAEVVYENESGGFREKTNGLSAAVLDKLLPGQRRRWPVAVGAFILLFGTLVTVFFLIPRPSVRTVADPKPKIVRLTENEYEEDMASWTRDGQIRFVRYITGTRAESWVMNADGSDQRRANEKIKSLLTGNWSPDGSRVVFVKDGESLRNVYLANSDGSGERKLPLSYPPNEWSPDGTKFVFGSIVDRSNAEIFVHDIENEKSVNVTNNAAFDADPTFSPDGRQILFVSSRDGNTEAYVMNSDGSGVKRLTDNPAVDAFPVFSPDGTQVVFDSNREGENVDIYIKNINDDSPPMKLTSLASNEEHRSNCWSPDGTRMVITSDASGKNNIYVINTEQIEPELILSDPDAELQYPSLSRDGTKLAYQAQSDDKSLMIRLFDVSAGTSKTIFRTAPDNANLALTPVFSPNGREIAFANKVDGNTDVFLIGLNGGNLVNLTMNAASDGSPAYSVDGQTIFFQSNREGAFLRFHLFRMDADGTDVRRLTDKPGYEFSPVPLPTGDRLLFSGDRADGVFKSLDVMILDLSKPGEEFMVASRRLHDSQPTVSPDGRRVAFVAQSDGNSELYLVNVDSTGLVRLTRHQATDRSPAFSYNGTELFFESDRDGRSAIYKLRLPN